MIKPKYYPKLIKTNYEYQIGESIENKVRRITENNEPITDGAPIIYTNREDGVLPSYNIRTDRWDVAQAAWRHRSNRKRREATKQRSYTLPM